MFTTSNVVEDILRNTPFLAENFEMGLINYSALARKIKPEVEKKLFKKVTVGSLIMALKRMRTKIKTKLDLSKILKEKPDLIIKSNLIDITLLNSEQIIEKQQTLFQSLDTKKQYFLTMTQGVFETTIICSQELKPSIQKIFQKEKVISEFNNLSSITIKFPQEIVFIRGLYAHILKTLAWENINVIEVVSTYSEITMILSNNELEKAFLILNKLFRI